MSRWKFVLKLVFHNPHLNIEFHFHLNLHLYLEKPLFEEKY